MSFDPRLVSKFLERFLSGDLLALGILKDYCEEEPGPLLSSDWSDILSVAAPWEHHFLLRYVRDSLGQPVSTSYSIKALLSLLAHDRVRVRADYDLGWDESVVYLIHEGVAYWQDTWDWTLYSGEINRLEPDSFQQVPHYNAAVVYFSGTEVTLRFSNYLARRVPGLGYYLLNDVGGRALIKMEGQMRVAQEGYSLNIRGLVDPEGEEIPASQVWVEHGFWVYT